MSHAHVEVVRNINSAVDVSSKEYYCFDFLKEVIKMVEFDNIKLALSNYDKPLQEMGNSL